MRATNARIQYKLFLKESPTCPIINSRCFSSVNIELVMRNSKYYQIGSLPAHYGSGEMLVAHLHVEHG
ncbi:hypothetical protein Y032_0053g2308 [Ancylostoma ceylanicum]|uniref:Uncharacterized protein n=1 Tax=Ancylostoma ceylanicum TaxID=53326 RepID=A0A016U6K7_9BILA|nr:hypothetical protein Y032_0053g2308 [Ancylostoma ceylanicum]